MENRDAIKGNGCNEQAFNNDCDNRVSALCVQCACKSKFIAFGNEQNKQVNK